MTDTSGTDPMVQSFFWGDATQGLTLDQLKARRAVAAAMASKARPYPTTVGQGLTALGEGLGQGLYERNLGIAEARQRALDVQELQRSKKPSEASPPAGASSGAAGSADAAATGAFGLGSPSTNVASEDSGPPAPVGTDALAGSVLAQQGVLPGSAPGQRIRMAALDTGTVSDAGSPGLTYGGTAAGPGASMMEPPTTAPPAPTAPSVAANAAAQQPAGPADTPVPGVAGGGQGPGGPAGRPPAPVGADAVAGSVLAQIGAGAPVPRTMPAPPAPPAAVPGATPGRIAPPYGQPTAPTTDLGPGGVRMEPSRPPPPIDPAPQRVDTPAMIQNRAVRNDPRMLGRRSESVLQQMDREYADMKEARDKAFERATEQWQKDRDFKLEWAKQHREHVIAAPGVQQKLQAEQDAAVDRMRFGTADYKKAQEAAADKSGDAAKLRANALHDLYKAIDLVRQNKVIGGSFAEGIPYTPLPGKLGVSKFMTEVGLGGLSRPLKSGPAHPYSDEAASTEEYQSLVRGVIGANLKAQYGTNPSNADLQSAADRYGLRLSLDNESKLRILENIKNEYLRTINDHTQEVQRVFNRPDLDSAVLRRNQVDVPFDPYDVQQLRANRTAAAAQAFEQRYGAGSAARALGGR